MPVWGGCLLVQQIPELAEKIEFLLVGEATNCGGKLSARHR